MPAAPASFLAGGDISPSRFVSVAGSDFTVTASGDNARIMGISQDGSREAPIPSVVTPLAAESGDSLRVFQQGEECLLELGGTVVVNDRIGALATGTGAAIATSGGTTENVGAIALEGGDSGDLIRVQVAIFAEESGA